MRLLICLSILPSIIIGGLIYKMDKLEREPKKEIIKALLMGVLSVVLTLIISWGFGILKILASTLNGFQIFLYSFIGVALVEEFSKWICVKLFLYKNKNFNCLFDGIVYAVFISLGFATIENLLYTMSGGIITALIRAVITVPSHAFYAIFMGYYISMAKTKKIEGNQLKYIGYLFLSLLLPIILHGTFDCLLLLQNSFLLVIFLFFVLFLYIISFQKVKKLSQKERLFTKNNIEYCRECGHKVYGKYCNQCGIEIK